MANLHVSDIVLSHYTLNSFHPQNNPRKYILLLSLIDWDTEKLHVLTSHKLISEVARILTKQTLGFIITISFQFRIQETNFPASPPNFIPNTLLDNFMCFICLGLFHSNIFLSPTYYIEYMRALMIMPVARALSRSLMKAEWCMNKWKILIIEAVNTVTFKSKLPLI